MRGSCLCGTVAFEAEPLETGVVQQVAGSVHPAHQLAGGEHTRLAVPLCTADPDRLFRLTVNSL